jgi:putative ABC transport system permease protein
MSDVRGANQQRAPKARSKRRPARTGGKEVRRLRDPRGRLRLADALALSVVGLRARRVRSALSALGVAIAIAALVAVLGLAASSKADLLAQLGEEGNLLTVASGQTFTGNPMPLPTTAESMIAAIPPVREVTAVGNVSSATVRRSAAVPAVQTGGISVLAAQPSLLNALSARLLSGRFLGALAQHYPETVLGYSAAQNLGIDMPGPQTQVYLGGTYYTVIGVLAPVTVAPEIDDAALISFPMAAALDLGARPTRIYLRVEPDQVSAVAAVLPFTASPGAPEAVEVRRPSDVLLARIAAKTAFVGLFLGLGAVALLVGGVGIANIMVISVLERRGEIGLRRALGARARHVAAQFLLESSALALLGGLLGVALGSLATAVAARAAGNPFTMPADAPLAGLAAALLVGAVAGLYPATRAARLAPADALRTL